MAQKSSRLVFSSLLLVCACFAEKPQKLSRSKYTICGQSLDLEIAKTEEQRNIGLMFRTEIPPGKGMLFVFPAPQPLQFWMKNVPMDIDIGYFDSMGQLVSYHTMKGTSPVQRPESLPNYPSGVPAQFAVEVEPGFYKKILGDSKACSIQPLPKVN
jgi:uncharacterized membrane protein (UPF0127 family)